MAANSLSLPVDIQWERICVSEDMMDTAVCDRDRPAKWQSSIAVFKYVPEDDYQTYQGRKITYLKVVCTISGYQPKTDEIEGILTSLNGLRTDEYLTTEIERRLSTYRPCNEAIIQVTVAPPPGKKIPLSAYPYVMDFQPKKRELYDAVTDSKEVMSRSLESLNIRKSAGTTASQEVLDIDKGFNIGVGAEVKGFGGNVQYGQNVERGTKQLASGDSGLARTTDESHERRETVSHTTQLTQLHHLLDSYHLGTNRIVFFIQPRPYTKQEPSGFVRGPRSVEGIQEFFLVVNQPKDQMDFCVDVRLDTGHLYEKPVMKYKYKSEIHEAPLLTAPKPVSSDRGNWVGNTYGSEINDGWSVDVPLVGRKTIWSYTARVKYDCYKRTLPSSSIYTPSESDYHIDVDNIQKDINNINGFRVLSENKAGDATCKIVATLDALTINTEATSRACIKSSASDVDIHTEVDWAFIAAAILLDPLGVGGVAASLLIGAGGGIVTFEAAKTVAIFTGATDPINAVESSIQPKVQVFLKSREEIEDTGRKDKVFFITTRGLCCCEGSTVKPEGTVFETTLKHSGWRAPTSNVHVGRSDEDVTEPTRTTVEPTGWGENTVLPAETVADRPPDTSLMTIDEANALSGTMRETMLQSLVSPRRTEPRPISETRMVTDLVLPSLLQNPSYRFLMRQPAVDVIPKELAGRLSKTFLRDIKGISRHDLLTASTSVVAKMAGIDDLTVNKLKAAILATPFKAPSVTKQTSTAQQTNAKVGKRAGSKQRGSSKESSQKSGK